VPVVLTEKHAFGAKTEISMQCAPVAQELCGTVLVHRVDGSVLTQHD